MKFIREYMAYLRDNPEGYWFKAKLYGWGWVPARWQGWATIFVFAAAIGFNAAHIDAASHSASDTLIGVVPETIALVLVLIGICVVKGEKPRWHWGLPKEEKDTTTPRS